MKIFKQKTKWRSLLVLLLFIFLGTMGQKDTVKAAGDYYLQVNKGTNVVTVFKNDGTPYKAFICSTGANTPIGTFQTKQKLRWHELDGPTYGQYCTRIVDGVLFHSVWYYRNGDYASQSYVQYNKLGTMASHGCVRLTVADAKWIYDNCPLGTTVKIIYGNSSNDPLGKPQSIKVDASQRMGWDPTDPYPGNPYAYLFPSINTSGKDTNIPFASYFDYIAGISAADSLGNDITSSVTYSGWVNPYQLGTYTVTYYVTDALGRTAQTSVNYQVTDTYDAVMSGVKKHVRKEYNSTYNLKAGIRAETVNNEILTNNIRVKIILPGQTKEKSYGKSKLKLTKTGTYKINYYVTNPHNGRVTKCTTVLKVKDTKKPYLKGIKASRTAEYNDRWNLRSGVTSKLVSGKGVTSKIKIQIKIPGSNKYRTLKDTGNESVNYKKYRFTKTGTYTVMYSVINPYNKKAVTTKKCNIVVKDTKKPYLKGIRASRTAEYNDRWNLRSGVTSKLVSGKGVTSKIKIQIKVPGSNRYRTLKDTGNESVNYKKYRFTKTGTYTVMYSIINPYNEKAVTTKKCNIAVRDTRKPYLKGIKASRTAEYRDVCNLRSGINASLVSGTDLTSKIRIQIKTPGSSSYINLKNTGNTAVNYTKYKFTRLGTYTVRYTVANPNYKNMVTQKYCNIKVKDTSAPVIVNNKPEDTAAVNMPYDVYDGITAKLVSGSEISSEDIMAVLYNVDDKGNIIKGTKISLTEDALVGGTYYTFTEAGNYKIIYEAYNGENSAVCERMLQVAAPQTNMNNGGN